MVKLDFNVPSKKSARAGLSNGVVYVDRDAYPWVGLKTVDVKVTSDMGEYVFLDGVPIDSRRPKLIGEYSVTCFTYPEQLNVGYTTDYPGVFHYTGKRKPFDFSWRTQKITNLRTTNIYHFLLNCSSNFSVLNNATNVENPTYSDFNLTIRSYPKRIGLYDVSYFWIDAEGLSDNGVEILENKLYGTSKTRPEIPSFDWVKNLFSTNPYSEIDKEVAKGMHGLQFGIGDDVTGNPAVGLYKINDTQRITEVSPGIYRYS